MKISIVIPNYNGEILLRKNLPLVLTVQGAEEVIVVDDGSTDESVELIKGHCRYVKGFKIIENKKNLGFSSTVNRGVEEATGEIVVLLNTDVCPGKFFLKPLLNHFSDPQVFAVGCLDKSIEDGKTILRGRGIGKWRRGFLVHARGEVDKNDTLWVSGGSGAFRKKIWDKLGGMDELYNPFYWEDIDLCWRAQKSGYKVLFESKSIAVHQHEEGAIKQKYSRFHIKTIAYRNQFIFVWKNITDWNRRFSHLIWLPFHLLRTTIVGDFAFSSGLLRAVLKVPMIIKSALKSQKLFIKTDKEILP